MQVVLQLSPAFIYSLRLNFINNLPASSSVAALGVYFVYTTLGDSLMTLAALFEVWICMMIAFGLKPGKAKTWEKTICLVISLMRISSVNVRTHRSL